MISAQAWARAAAGAAAILAVLGAFGGVSSLGSVLVYRALGDDGDAASAARLAAFSAGLVAWNLRLFGPRRRAARRPLLAEQKDVVSVT